MRNGLKLFDYFAGDKFGEGISGTQMAALRDHLFNKFVPGLKAELYPEALKRNMEKYSGKGWNEDQIHQLTAREVNAAFGMQDEIWSGRSKFMSDLLRLTALAPDFLESRARFVGQALRPGGAEQRRALLKQGLYMYAGARVLNALSNDGDAKWDPSDAFTWHIKGKTVTIRSVITDAQFAATDFGGFMATRGALIPRAFGEAYHEMRQPKFMKTKGSMVEAAIRGQAPIMLQGLTSSLWQKYIEKKQGVSVAFETFKSIIESTFGAHVQSPPKPRSGTSLKLSSSFRVR
jgi:hypothetical protein